MVVVVVMMMQQWWFPLRRYPPTICTRKWSDDSPHSKNNQYHEKSLTNPTPSNIKSNVTIRNLHIYVQEESGENISYPEILRFIVVSVYANDCKACRRISMEEGVHMSHNSLRLVPMARVPMSISRES